MKKSIQARPPYEFIFRAPTEAVYKVNAWTVDEAISQFASIRYGQVSIYKTFQERYDEPYFDVYIYYGKDKYDWWIVRGNALK